MKMQAETIRSEDALFDFLLQYVRKCERRKRFPQGMVEVVHTLIEEVRNGVDTLCLREDIQERFPIGGGVSEAGGVPCYASLVRWAATILDEADTAFVDFPFSNRLLIEAIGIQGHFELACRGDSIWLQEGTPLRRLGYRVELKQEYEYVGLGFRHPLDADVLELV